MLLNLIGTRDWLSGPKLGRLTFVTVSKCPTPLNHLLSSISSCWIQSVIKVFWLWDHSVWDHAKTFCHRRSDGMVSWCPQALNVCPLYCLFMAKHTEQMGLCICFAFQQRSSATSLCQLHRRRASGSKEIGIKYGPVPLVLKLGSDGCSSQMSSAQGVSQPWANSQTDHHLTIGGGAPSEPFWLDQMSLSTDCIYPGERVIRPPSQETGAPFTECPYSTLNEYLFWMFPDLF